MINDLLILFAVFSLVLLNGLFVAAELALVSVRQSRIDQLSEQGVRRAAAVQRALSDPNRFISACQVGISMASLMLGWIAAPSLVRFLEPRLASLTGGETWLNPWVLAAAIALLLVTMLHIVIAEMTPKMVALQKAEEAILVTAPLVSWLAVPFRPLIALLYFLTGLILKALGLQWIGPRSLVYNEDELKMLVTASQQGGFLEASEQQMIERVFGFHDVKTDEVMVPRTEMQALPASADLNEVVAVVIDSGHARYPVYGQDLDDVIGVFHAKDLLREVTQAGQRQYNLRRLVRPALMVSSHTPLDELLTTMKARRTHMAIVVDEYGGTAGLVTLENVLERIVGDVQDEFEEAEVEVEVLDAGRLRLSGLLLISEVNERFGTRIEDPYYNTIGGFVFGQLGRKPELGDTVRANGHLFTVAALDGLRIERVEVEHVEDEGTTDELADEPSVVTPGPTSAPSDAHSQQTESLAMSR
jgi:CBS domain containing-hemolysin-like protein